MSPGHAALRLGGLGESSFIGLFLIFFGLPGSHRLLKQSGRKRKSVMIEVRVAPRVNRAVMSHEAKT